MQMFLFERIIARIVVSPYHDNFILKGGLLLASMIGEDKRTTKDMDATIKGLKVDEKLLNDIVNNILSINLNDETQFTIISLKEIIDNNEYGGFRFNIKVQYYTIVVYLAVDISIGDEITPKELKYRYKSMFSAESFLIMAYPPEAIMAEKFESIITKGENNTRAKDFYDIYMLLNDSKIIINNTIMILAINKTFQRRNTDNYLKSLNSIINDLKSSEMLLKTWNRYQNDHYYAYSINFKDIIINLEKIIYIINHKGRI